MQDILVGIIGFGRIGAEHAGWLNAARGIRAVAADDITPARCALAAARGLKTYDTLEAMVVDRSVDAVLISTPTAMHFEHAMLALEAGKHVMIEKPMALDLDEARRLLHEARARNRVLSVFHNRRWDIDYLTVREAIQSGAFGKVINVESRLGQYASCVGPAAREYRPTWRNEAAFGGGGLYDWGTHFVDQLWRLLWPAKPVRVFAQLRGNVWSSDCDDFARILIDFDNGVVGLCEINTTTTRPLLRWHVDGVAGSASSPPSETFNTFQWAELEFTPAVSGRPSSIYPRASAGLDETQIWEQFAAAVRGNGEPAVTPQSVLPTMALLDAARHSSQHQEAADVQGVVEWVY
ncbi:MAG TPA: Gfo/Idh/MocA family oxidoreductase [Tepidisphaeraceae bacterium]|jgi:predicted dehydrogenase